MWYFKVDGEDNDLLCWLTEFRDSIMLNGSAMPTSFEVSLNYVKVKEDSWKRHIVSRDLVYSVTHHVSKSCHKLVVDL